MPLSTTYATRLSSIWIWLALLFVILTGVASAQSADVSITVSGVRNASYGTLFRSSTSSVAYTSTNAAEFAIVGKQNKAVRITVSASTPTRGSITLPLSIQQTECAYSLDDGATWTRFTTGTHFQDAYFPTGTQNGYVSGTIRIRVGGTVTSGATQQQGTYGGTITVSAAYR